ncbi:MAG: hypothetical protein NVS3B28_13030 [Candidatus Velthaea sp.]
MHVDSATVHKTGSDPKDVILIPGLGSGTYVWDGIAPELAQRVTVYTVAFDGFDGAPAGKALYLNSFTRSVADLIAQEHLTKPLLLGHSLGGTSPYIWRKGCPVRSELLWLSIRCRSFRLRRPVKRPHPRKAAAAEMQAAMLASPDAAQARRHTWSAIPKTSNS